MLRATPPAIAVGFAVRLAAYAAYVSFASGIFEFSESWSALTYGAHTVANVLVAAGAIDLGRRRAGSARVALWIAGGSQLAVIAGQIATSVMMQHQRDEAGFAHVQLISAWVWSVGGYLWMLGIAVAGGRRAAVWSGLAIAVMLVISPVPPLYELYGRDLVVAVGVLGRGAVYVVQVALHLAVVEIAARRAREPVRDHLRAARALRWLGAASIARAIATTTLLAFALVGTTTSVLGAAVVDSAVGLAATVLAVAGWLLGRAQFPRLPRYIGHLAFASAGISALAIIPALERTLEHNPYRVEVELWWGDVAATFATACVVFAIGLYARTHRGVRSSTIVCGGVFTVCACMTIVARGEPVAFAVFATIANIAAAPLMYAAAREVADDPVQTAADVFA